MNKNCSIFSNKLCLWISWCKIWPARLVMVRIKSLSRRRNSKSSTIRGRSKTPTLSSTTRSSRRGKVSANLKLKKCGKNRRKMKRLKDQLSSLASTVNRVTNDAPRINSLRISRSSKIAKTRSSKLSRMIFWGKRIPVDPSSWILNKSALRARKRLTIDCTMPPRYLCRKSFSSSVSKSCFKKSALEPPVLATTTK